jgi:hypothetical protein
MATMLYELLLESSVLLCVFCGRKDSVKKDIHTEMFPVYGGKCLPCKAVHNWVEKFSESCLKVADDARPDAEVAEATDKRSLYCGF